MPPPPVNIILILISVIIISIVFVLKSSLSAKAEANSYALLIGINKYEGENNSLFGAVNDIELLNTTLQKYAGFKAENITLLSNAGATKENIYKKWQSIIKKSQQGDTIIFSFSGHGFHEYDRDGDDSAKDEDDPFDEILLTSGFNRKRSRYSLMLTSHL